MKMMLALFRYACKRAIWRGSSFYLSKKLTDKLSKLYARPEPSDEENS